MIFEDLQLYIEQLPNNFTEKCWKKFKCLKYMVVSFDALTSILYYKENNSWFNFNYYYEVYELYGIKY